MEDDLISNIEKVEKEVAKTENKFRDLIADFESLIQVTDPSFFLNSHCIIIMMAKLYIHTCIDSFLTQNISFQGFLETDMTKESLNKLEKQLKQYDGELMREIEILDCMVRY